VLSVPFTAIGSLSAHGLAYRLTAPDASARAKLLHSTGHSYLEYTTVFFAVCLGLIVAGAALVMLRAARGRSTRALPAWPFAVLPLAMFLVQEHAERLFHDGQFPFGAVLEPEVYRGLILQLPFAALMYLAARALFALAENIGRLIAGRMPTPAFPSPYRISFPVFGFEAPRISALASCSAGRAPPSSPFSS
jgi:hypothetical protein